MIQVIHAFDAGMITWVMIGFGVWLVDACWPSKQGDG